MGMESDATRSLKGKAIFFDKVKDMHELIYGKKIKQEVTGDQVIRVFWQPPEEEE